MATSPTLSTTVLGKRKTSSLVLRLSSSPAPTDGAPVAGPSTETSTANLQVVLGSTLPVGKKSRYPCTYTGCNKTYSKPSRLSEHYRSHTGERPFVCKECGKSYLRETHLQAHTRSHLPDSERPYVCTEDPDCKKRFWTSQHLQVHENIHRGEKSYLCTEAGCDEIFAKHHQLRSHVCTVHSPSGTKPYICSHPGCTKSFSTNQKLKGHMRTHDDRRYTCSHIECLPGLDKDPLYFGTWTALQAHVRTAHPPTCTYPACKGRTFASHNNLRCHLKLHEQQELEATLYSSLNDTTGDEPEASRPQKRRRGGEWGREWKCDFPDCGKDFKSKKALTTHNSVIHLGQRNHVCPHQHCKSAFGYKHLLQRHLVKLHSTKAAQSETGMGSSGDEALASDMEETGDFKTIPDTTSHVDIDAITGRSYALRFQKSTPIRCPYPHVEELLATATLDGLPGGSSKKCDHLLTRAYDLRRHLKAEHGIDTDKENVDAWVKVQKRAPTP